MLCPRCAQETENTGFCGHCGMALQHGTARVGAPRRSSPRVWALWFGLAFVGVHGGAVLLLRGGLSFWQSAGVYCTTAFVTGLLAGALRLMTPMDAEAIGEPVAIPSTLPGRAAPILILAVLLSVVATPVAGLVFYVVLGYAKSCVDNRVLAIFGLAILSSLILGAASAAAPFIISSRLMLPAMMVGWAFSSFFRSDPW